MRETGTHIYFWGTMYSNFYSAPFVVDGITFETSEQFFMYQKALTFGDMEIAKKILNADTPQKCKSLGRRVSGFNEEEWDKVRYDIMYNGCFNKFSQNPQLKKELIGNKGKTFVEASPYDTVWGVGLAEEDALILDERNWRGQNLLGKILTQLSQQL